jgi:hypothetical protein
MSNTGHVTNLDAPKPDWCRRRAWRRFLLWFLTTPAAIAVAFQLQPAHVVLDIPVTPNRVGYFWWEEQSSQLFYADSWGVLYLHRKVGTAYPDAQGWQTAEEAFAHFNSWLTSHGWTYTGPGFDSPAVPESRLLKPERSQRFQRGTDRDVQATVTVWPIGAPSSGFHVIVTTERPSWARILQRGLD